MNEYLKPLAPKLPQTVYYYLDEVYKEFDITSGNRRNFFLTHALIESAYFSKMEECLFYTTAARIAAVWPSRFNMTGTGGKLNANEFVRNPQKLANVVYAGRMGNKDVNDGWTYRGRSIFGLTGKDAYVAYSLFSGVDCVSDPDILTRDLREAFRCGGWFFAEYKKLLKFCDEGNFAATVLRVNGSMQTLPERTNILQEVIKCRP